MESIKVGGVEEHFNLPWHLLKESGRLTKLGIDLQWVDCPGGTGQMTKLFADGELDMAVLLTEGMIMDILHGGLARILTVYVQSSLIWGIHVSQKSNLEILHQDKGLIYAISRKGSGSHLMAMVNAKENVWALDSLQFNEVGSLAGAIEAFEQEEAEVFLWEKFTTDPHCVKGPLKRIGSIPTPWPCFVIAVNPTYYLRHKELVDQLVDEVFTEASMFKQNLDAPSIVAERYGLTVANAQKWFDSVEWGSGRDLTSKEVATVLEALKGVGKADAELEADELKRQINPL